MLKQGKYQVTVTLESNRLSVAVSRFGQRLPIPNSEQQHVAYAVMALARTSDDADRPVRADQLFEYAPFSKATLHTLRSGFGSRHVGTILPAHDAQDLIKSEEITKSWRLDVDPASIEFLPDRDAVAIHLESCRRRDPVAQQAFLRWATCQTRALLAIDYKTQLGLDMSDAAAAALEAAGERRDWQLLAHFQAVRVHLWTNPEALQDAYEVLLGLIDQPGEHTALAECLRLRALAMRSHARRGDADQHPTLIRQLRDGIDQARHRGDLAAASQLLNTLGVILIRHDPYSEEIRDQARSAYQEALTLQLLFRDAMLLQAISHNAAMLEAAPTLTWRAPGNPAQIQQLELALLIGVALKVSNYSCMTKVHLAVLYASSDRFPDAERLLADAKVDLGRLQSPSEDAHYAFAAAHIAWWYHDLRGPSPSHRRTAISELEHALKSFREALDPSWENTIQSQLNALRANRPLSIEWMRKHAPVKKPVRARNR